MAGQAPLSFRETLDRSARVAALGDVRLQYQPGLVIGELRSPGGRAWPLAALSAGALAAGLSAFLLLGAGGSSGAALLLVLLCGALLAAAARVGRSARTFVLNLQTGTLRLDAPSITGRPATRLVPFDDVVGLDVETRGPRTRKLVVRLRQPEGGPRGATLVSGIRPAEQAALERLERLLRGAFGL